MLSFESEADNLKFYTQVLKQVSPITFVNAEALAELMLLHYNDELNEEQKKLKLRYPTIAEIYSVGRQLRELILESGKFLSPQDRLLISDYIGLGLDPLKIPDPDPIPSETLALTGDRVLSAYMAKDS